MSNTLTGLIQYIYDTVDHVSQEPTGMINAVTINGKAEMAALNQDISYDLTAVGVPRNITPAAGPPTLVDETTTAGTMQLTKARSVPFYWTGDDEAKLGLEGKTGIQNNKIAQAIRVLRLEMEADLTALHALTSRAYTSHATTPPALFASSLAGVADVAQILTDNGAPPDRSLIINTKAGTAIRNLLGFGSFQGGTNLQSGILMPLHGLDIRESSQIVTTTAVGNNTGTYAVNGAHAVGATTITVKTGSGTILAGDVITFGTDTATKYVVTTGVDNGTTIVIGGPGLVKALAGNEAVAIIGVCTRNIAFARSAIHLLARLPKLPTGGDAATDELIVQDPVTGLPFRFAQYKGYHANQFEVGLAWGVKNAVPKWTGLLLGN